MSSLAMKRVVATALAGAAIASAIGTPAASARVIDPLRVPPPPSSIAASAGQAYEELRRPDAPPPPSSIAAPAGEAYEELRAPTQPTGESQPVLEEPAQPVGFDLPSAAIGAATGAGLVIALLVAGGLVRRRPLTRSHDTVGA